MYPVECTVLVGMNIVALKDQVVAQDVLLTLADVFPQTQSVAVTNDATLSTMLEDEGEIRIVVLEVSPALMLHNSRLKTLCANGTRVILIGQRDEAESLSAFPFQSLEKPFSTDALVSVLQSER